MGEALKRRYGLLALKVRLDTYGSRDEPIIRLVLEAKVEGEFRTVGSWTFKANEFGLPETISGSRGQSFEFRMPTGLVQDLRRLLQGEFAGQALWLHLVRPYGYVGLIPWERLLVPELKVAVLRLPDFIVPPPRESRRVLDVLLCASAPIAKEFFPAVGYLGRMARRLVDHVPRNVRLHCFVDDMLAGPLGGELKSLNLLDHATVYQASEAERYSIPEASTRIVDDQGRLRSPWLLWMRDALRGKSVDVVHMMCHGYFANDRGALALSQSPVVNADPRMSRFVGPTELGAFMTKVGAWAGVISAPQNNYSDLGSRALTEELGQTQPGAALFHDAERDPGADALASAYRFLFSPARMEPVVSPHLFMYCQPHRLPYGEAEAKEHADGLSTVFEQQDNVPAWLAAGQRYIEKYDLEVRRTARSRGSNASVLSADEDTLKRIQNVMANVAKSHKLT